MPLLDASGQPIATPYGPAIGGRIPTYDEMKKFLDVVTGTVLMFLKQRGCDPMTAHSIGVIISKMTFDPKTQTAVEVENIISKAATEQLEKIKLGLLQASVDPTITETPKASA